jgi:hypothetical protein
MTVRLIAAIAFTDLLAHVGEFYSVSNAKLPLGATACEVVIGFRLFARTFYCFTNIAICFHLYRGLVLLKKSTWRFEVLTWVVTIAMVSIFTGIYAGLGAFTGVKNKKGCNPGADDKTLNTIFYWIIGLVNVFTIAIGIFTTIVGHRSLNAWINKYADSRSYKGEDPTKFKKDRRKMAVRSFLYPLSTCITLPFEGLFFILNAFNIYIFEITIPNVLGTGLSGVLTALAFSIDPSTHKAFAAAYAQVRHKLSNREGFNDNISESTDTISLKRAV